jgi:hypothetical protein
MASLVSITRLDQRRPLADLRREAAFFTVVFMAFSFPGPPDRRMAVRVRLYRQNKFFPISRSGSRGPGEN